MSITYKSCQSAAGRPRGETNDCTVKAVAIACQMPYIKAHALMKDAGRKDGRGFNALKTNKVIEQQHFKVEIVQGKNGMQANKFPKAKTISSAVKVLPKDKTYLIYSTGHVSVFRNGTLDDWAEETARNRIIAIFEVTPMFSKNALKKMKRGN